MDKQKRENKNDPPKENKATPKPEPKKEPQKEAGNPGFSS